MLTEVFPQMTLPLLLCDCVSLQNVPLHLNEEARCRGLW